MTQVPAWFERKFDFSFPVELYPNVCVRLRGTPARLEEFLRACPPQSLTKKPDDKWSIQEHAGHLLDLEPLWAARVEDFIAGRSALTVADLSNRGTTDANHNARPLDRILRDFREARMRLLDRAEHADMTLGRAILHPRLKQPMRLIDHLYFVAEHDDHHLARIWELMRQGGKDAVA
jgi:uncharacterized damage-inducible protein DinB